MPPYVALPAALPICYRVWCDKPKAERLHNLVFADAKRKGYDSWLLAGPIRRWKHDEPEIGMAIYERGKVRFVKEMPF